MTLFNHKSPTHIRILKEELARAKRILREGYSADTIWDKMTKEDRETALDVAEETNPDKFKTALYVAKIYIEQLIDITWDEVPADIQDLIDLSDFKLAKDDREGRNLLSGIDTAITNPAGKQFVDKFLKKIGRTSLRDITIKQATQLNLGVGQYIASKNKNPGINVADIDWKDYDGTSNRQDWRGGRIS
tara:strand:+ start:5598 stop:6164 length:567 start_codon:yes stop_codon:yes gene_type:complete